MESQLLVLRRYIEKEVFVTKDKEMIIDPDGTESAWLFDFRRVILHAETLDLVGELFWGECKDEYPFQVCGIEAAAIPLVTGFILKLREKGKPTNGFFIRKSRKKSGLLRMIEGTMTDEAVILVDDILNTGKSLIRQIEVLEALGKKVSAVFTILRFRDPSYYTYFYKKGIRIHSLFELNDFKDSLNVKNAVDRTEKPVPMPFEVQWYWKVEKADYFQVVPKSAPVLDGARIFFGTDGGDFYALNQADGTVAWNYKTLFGSKKKKRFSSPVLFDGMVYFGASDGNFYALDKETGWKKWMFLEADWIESSPCIASDLGLIFVGLEFGLWNKRGGMVALDLKTGKKKWEYPMQGSMHSSPAYSAANKLLVSSSGDSMHGFDAKTGKLLWTHKTDGEIMGSSAFDEKRDHLCFGSFDSYVYILKTKTGELVHKIKTEEALYSTPLVHGDFAYAASLDKNLYCVNMDTGVVAWKFATNGRIFASPEIIDGKVYIGSNDGRLYELDKATGINTAFFQATERITDKIAYNKNTDTLFLPTFGNEIYSLKRKVENP